MNEINALILGVVEGFSEFLPISSTGHLILTAELLKISHTDFLKSFELAIQLGAILSVIALYCRSLLTDFATLKKVAIAFAPTAGIGLIFYRFMKQHLLGSTTVVLWSLLLGGIFLVIFELLYRKRGAQRIHSSSMSCRQALLIGVFQSLAMIPGVSRSAATIIGGLILGLERRKIVEFSFLLAIPTMAAAVGFDLVQNAAGFSSTQVNILAIGFLTSFIVALAAVKLFLSFVARYSFISFGVYRIVLALLFWMYLSR